VTAKLKKGLVGIAVGVTAGLFLVLALLYALNGFGWLLWYVLPTGHSPNFFWGFFALAVILVLLGVLAGLIAYRVLRTSSPPMPTMAIDEARKIRETVESHAEGTG
jgi:H+/Cl- antiporter ClcA